MTGINGFDITKYDVGGTQSGDKAGDKKLTGDEVLKAQRDGWTVWDGYVEGDCVEHYKSDGSNKGQLTKLLKTWSNMTKSESYKKFAKRKAEILEQKMAELDIYPYTDENGNKVYHIDTILFDENYKKAEKEADAQARKELGLSDKTYSLGFGVPKSKDKDDKTIEDKKEEATDDIESGNKSLADKLKADDTTIKEAIKKILKEAGPTEETIAARNELGKKSASNGMTFQDAYLIYKNIQKKYSKPATQNGEGKFFSVEDLPPSIKEQYQKAGLAMKEIIDKNEDLVKKADIEYLGFADSVEEYGYWIITDLEYPETEQTKESSGTHESDDIEKTSNENTNRTGTHKTSENTYHPEQQLDGYIDTVAQGTTGDCWLISGLNALSENQWGRDAIKKAINIKSNGDVVITLKGAYGKKKQFTVTAQELNNAKNSSKYSSGDMDVLAIELAVEKYRKQFGERLDGGQEEEIFRLITGSHNTKTISNKQGIKNQIARAKASPEKYAMSANFYLGKGEYHAYNISRFETDEYGNKFVILTNPWSSQTEIKITEQEFLKYVVEIQTLENPTGINNNSSANVDGEIGETKAAKKGTDFNVAPAIHAVANSRPEMIKNCVNKDSNGNIKVTLKGVGRTFTITPKEFAKAKDSGKYTQGDDDVIAIEIAMEKYGAEQYSNVSLADEVIWGNLPRSGATIYAISDTNAIYLLTGEENMVAQIDENGKYTIGSLSEKENANSIKLDLSKIDLSKLKGKSNS